MLDLDRIHLPGEWREKVLAVTDEQIREAAFEVFATAPAIAEIR